ncbi:DUF302 domain-containing protein [Cuniculiplasma divulgatum]|uniref:DUF302 domain-containing protein n=1 Tax=Cuniculiplasma divulgatum TaxID=1673428 RepID=A0A1N5W1Q0_9ARCH|nr:DUF302 domain-containing protein [Cuniculiplasma divulgatum]SIM78899.1 hypothetical protein CSP5_1608 [Cuniculiplasma divulgatum]SJK85385.1 hypothetical protein CPM_1598 [Cuniculiplasma divulgatum]
MLSEESFIRKILKLNFNESVKVLKNGLENSGFKIFSEIDHSIAAKEVDLELFPARVIIFGNPKGGTGMIMSNPELAIDLPARILVYEKDGTHVLYRRLESILKTHNMEELSENGKSFDSKIQKIIDDLSKTTSL